MGWKIAFGLFLGWEGSKRQSLFRNTSFALAKRFKIQPILDGNVRSRIIHREYVLKCLQGPNSWLFTRNTQMLLISWKYFGKNILFHLQLLSRCLEIGLFVVPSVIFSALFFILTSVRKSKSNGSISAAFRTTTYGHLVYALRKCGGAFVKAGQWASTRPDIFPDELCTQLSQLHSDALPHSIEWTLSLLNPLFPEYISSINPRPIGCGTVAQVYEAVLVDGQRVAIKVLHPNILEKIKIDLKILKSMSRLLEFFIPSFKWINLPGELELFSRIMFIQCDLRRESYNLELFVKNFSTPLSKVTFPFPIFCNKNVLVETLEKGIPLQEFIQDASISNSKKDKMAKILFKALMKMILKDNFIHADLHPGNVFVKTNEKELIFLDAGLSTRLNSTDHKNFIDLFSAIVIHQDGYLAGELLIDRSHPMSQETVIDRDGFCKEIEELVAKVTKPSKAIQSLFLSKVSFGDVFRELLVSIKKHHVKLNENYANIIMSILCIEGIGRQLSHGIDLLPLLKDVANMYIQTKGL